LAASVSESNRMAEIQAWGIDAKLSV
jgi:hypothetical protein